MARIGRLTVSNTRVRPEGWVSADVTLITVRMIRNVNTRETRPRLTLCSRGRDRISAARLVLHVDGITADHILGEFDKGQRTGARHASGHYVRALQSKSVGKFRRLCIRSINLARHEKHFIS